jgi:sulfur carrier protein
LHAVTARLAKGYKIAPMKIMLNGESRTFEGPTSVADLLIVLGYAGKRVAVERNGQIVPRSAHEHSLLADDDQIEIVVAVGGG